ncbi:MAG: hypothetical protein R2774_05225 [Saprospiraceae bacterium]
MKWSYILCVSAFLSCTRNETNNSSLTCEKACILNDDTFNSLVPNEELSISMAFFQDGCLTVEYSSGGCDGSTWVTSLVASQSIVETNPPMREIKLNLIDNEDCEALIYKTSSFDVSDLRGDYPTVFLILDGYDERIVLNE